MSAHHPTCVGDRALGEIREGARRGRATRCIHSGGAPAVSLAARLRTIVRGWHCAYGRVRFAVENMYPWRAGPSSFGASLGAYAPDWDIRNQDYRHATVDLSHTAVSRTDPREMVADLGERVAHVHLADGTDSARDEHLVPGRGDQPVAEVLQSLRDFGFTGTVIAEVTTRGAANRDERIADLHETLEFTRSAWMKPQ